ncbi:hypothetical protein EVAR_93828_1 [Eumeta japonica]|uniref:Secreted protein n=1 Tax=Eumeta variegata TaxID=151549 RepID=A0A4C1TXT3_EUMVA|nr:hypothetical protein EVAR_93828_1 [Eumeta japonica]
MTYFKCIFYWTVVTGTIATSVTEGLIVPSEAQSSVTPLLGSFIKVAQSFYFESRSSSLKSSTLTCCVPELSTTAATNTMTTSEIISYSPRA